jgi:hypothetical protein
MELSAVWESNAALDHPFITFIGMERWPTIKNAAVHCIKMEQSLCAMFIQKLAGVVIVCAVRFTSHCVSANGLRL